MDKGMFFGTIRSQNNLLLLTVSPSKRKTIIAMKKFNKVLQQGSISRLNEDSAINIILLLSVDRQAE